MTLLLNRLLETIPAVTVTQPTEDLHHIPNAACGRIIWQRPPLVGLQNWMDGLISYTLFSARLGMAPDPALAEGKVA